MATYHSLVGNYATESDARSALERLESEGISGEVVSADLDGAYLSPGLPHPEGFLLVVSQEDRKRAIAVLALDPEAELEEDWEESAEHAIDGWICSWCDTEVSLCDAFCPECGAPRSDVRAEDADDEG